jgi:hypothetical protein
MPFTIEMEAPARPDPESANQALASELLQAFPSIADFPLDHDLIAREVVHVPRADVLKHWPQIELHGDDSIGAPTIRLWQSNAFVDLPSRPPESCVSWLGRVQPLLNVFRQRGFRFMSVEELVEEYEAQRRRVEHVARLVRDPLNDGT